MRVFSVVMQKNQTRGYEQCCATSLFLLHLLWASVNRRLVDYSCLGAEEFLLASADHAFRAHCFSLSGKKFANVIQFIS